MRIDKDQIANLRQLPIEGVASKLGMKVVNHKAQCYAHPDNNPSFSFRGNKGKCWSCGETVSDPLDLCVKYGRMSFRAAVAFLAGGESMIREEYQPKVEEPVVFDGRRYERCFEHPVLSQNCVEFCEERRYARWAVEWLRLASWDGGKWLVFPYYDLSKPYPKLVGIEKRNMSLGSAGAGSAGKTADTGARGEPRYVFPKGVQASKLLFNLQVLNQVPVSQTIYLCEGVTDVVALTSDRLPAIGFGSASLFRAERNASLLSPLAGRNVVMVADNDQPGEVLFGEVEKAAGIVGFNLERFPLPKEYKDYSDYHKVYYNESSSKA